MPNIPEGERVRSEPLPAVRGSDARVPGAGMAAALFRGTLWKRAIAWYRHGSATRALLVISALFAAIFLLIAQTVMAQRQARQGVMLQDEAMLSLDTLMETMLNAETGQRGFLLTGKVAYLAPYQLAKARLDPEVGALQRLSQRASDQEQVRIARAQQLIGAKIAEMDRTIELARAGMMPAAVALVQTNSGQRDMDELRGEVSWLRADQALQRQAAFGRVQTLENRLLPLVGLLSLGMVLVVVVALRGERQRASAEVEARQLAALRAANEESHLLARELNHRVQNLFSVVLSIITISARKQAPTAEVLDDIRARVHALSLAHSSSQGLGLQESCRLADVISNIMRPYADDLATANGVPGRVRLSGPDVDLPARMITPMGLLIHELATNGTKYGALSVASGIVEIAWHVASTPAGGRTLHLVWSESGGPGIGSDISALAGTATGTADPAAPAKGGFGSRLIAMAAKQMGGSLTRTWPVTGAQVNLNCPLP